MIHWVLTTGALVFFILGVLSAVRAVMTARTPQGAIAWASLLVTWPIITVPCYWVFGRNRFHGKVRYRRGLDAKLDSLVDTVTQRLSPYTVEVYPEHANARVIQSLSLHPLTEQNDVQLLVDGPAIFEAIFAAMDRAQSYVLAEFYIVNDDQLGRRFKSHLLAAKQRGCQVYLLYDDIGSKKMTAAFRRDLSDAGVHVTRMNTTRGRGNRFQVNFRNHRKIVVCDGTTAFIGGANVGDEYVHLDPHLTPWRDTHVRIDGPAAISAQFTFIEDWHWATGEVPQVSWQPEVAHSEADKTVVVLSSGPDDEHETCGLFFTHLANVARERLWIASPYFVPDEGIFSALKIAAMRGVDVRIIIPGMPDHPLVKQAAMAYIPELTHSGIRVYEYGEGFMHQKVLLVDDSTSVIGTANFDNRSFRLNFEVSAIIHDSGIASEVESMLKADLEKSIQIDAQAIESRSFLFRFAARAARLFAPVL